MARSGLFLIDLTQSDNHPQRIVHGSAVRRSAPRRSVSRIGSRPTMAGAFHHTASSIVPSGPRLD